MSWLEELTGYLDSTGNEYSEDKKIAEDLKNQRSEEINQEKQDYINNVQDILSSEDEELAELKGELAEQFGIEGEVSEEDIEKIINFLEENYEDLIAEEFLVRGARLYCNCGSHERKLNVLKDHGVYTEGMPMIHELDRVAEENITFFGICNSGSKYLETKDVMLKQVTYDDNGNEIVENIKGKKCEPYIIGNWEDTKEDVRIVDNGDKDPLDKFRSANSSRKGHRVVTTKSFLVCKHGGIIEPLDSGQEMLYVEEEEFPEVLEEIINEEYGFSEEEIEYIKNLYNNYSKSNSFDDDEKGIIFLDTLLKMGYSDYESILENTFNFGIISGVIQLTLPQILKDKEAFKEIAINKVEEMEQLLPLSLSFNEVIADIQGVDHYFKSEFQVK